MQRSGFTNAGFGLAIGIALGVALGLAVDNLAVGVALGVALGFGIGNGLEMLKIKKLNEASPEVQGQQKKQRTTLFVIFGLILLSIGLYVLTKLRPLLF